MNIIFFGSGYINSAAMQLSRVIAGEEECNWAGFIDSFKLIVEMHRIEPKYSLEKYYKTKNPLPISFYFRKIPKDVIDMFDIIFVEQNGFAFKNDVDIPIIYYHRDIPTALFMEDMDILLYRFKSMEGVISKEYPHIWNNGIHKQQFLNGVDMASFSHDFEKIHKGINWIGWKHTFEYYWDYPKQKEYYQHVKDIVLEAKERKLIKYHEHGIPYLEYRKILMQSEAVLIIPGKDAYVTRKIYEAAASRTLIVLYVQDYKAKEIYDNLGLIDGVNCLMFTNVDELESIKNFFKDVKIKTYTDNAYDWVKNNHTWDHRAKELIEICKKIKNKKEVVYEW